MRIKKFLELETEAKELQQRAKGRYVKTDDNGITKIDLVIGIWLDRTKEAIIKNPRNVRSYVKEYKEMLIAFHNVLEYIEYADNYVNKTGYVYRMIENELLRIDYIRERELVVEIG